MRLSKNILLIMAMILFCAGSLAARNSQEKWLSKKPIIKEVDIIGNDHISTDKIKDAISTKAQGFLQKIGLRGKNRLKKNSQQLDGAAISYLYKQNGFYDVKYQFLYEMAPDSSAIVKIHIDEGPQYFIDTAKIVGELGYREKRVEKILNRIKPGEPFNPYKLNGVSASIKELYANDGRPYATVKYDTKPVKDTSTHLIVDYRIDPGPLTVFGKIKIDSLKYTSPHVVRRELLFKQGDVYSRQKLIDSRQRIYSTGLFTYVDFQTNVNPDSTDTSPNLDIVCSEKKPRFIRLQTGAAQDTLYSTVWNLGLEMGNRDISGMGRQLTVAPVTTFQIASGWRLIEEKFGFYYTEPWPFGVRMPLNFALVWDHLLKVPYESGNTDINVRTYSLNISTLKEIGKFINIRSGFQYESVKIRGGSAESITQYKRDQEISEGRSIWAIFDRDSRPNIFIPRSGSVIRITPAFYGSFLGGDKNFFKIVLDWSHYIRTSRWAVYAFRFKTGWAKSFESDGYIPTTDLFFIGGANTIRGYKENDVGPKDAEGVPIGGKFYFITNHEYRRNLIGKFWFSLFLDVGNNWRSEKDAKFKGLLATAGIGVQYMSPLGPLRLDYGQRIAWEGVKGGGRFHISILYAF
jgi:outer membrane protein insertion porin family